MQRTRLMVLEAFYDEFVERSDRGSKILPRDEAVRGQAFGLRARLEQSSLHSTKAGMVPCYRLSVYREMSPKNELLIAEVCECRRPFSIHDGNVILILKSTKEGPEVQRFIEEAHERLRRYYLGNWIVRLLNERLESVVLS